MKLNFYSITLLSCADFSLNIQPTITAYSNISPKMQKYGDRDWLFVHAVWFYRNHTRYPTTPRWKQEQISHWSVELNWYLKLCCYWCIQRVLCVLLFHLYLSVTKLTVVLSMGLLYDWWLLSSMFKCIPKFSEWFLDFSPVKPATWLKPPSRANYRTIMAYWKDATSPLGLYFSPQRAIWVIAKMTF